MDLIRSAGCLVMEDIEIDTADPVEWCRRGREAFGLGDSEPRASATETAGYENGASSDREDNEEGRMGPKEADRSERLSCAGPMSEHHMHCER